MSQANIPNPVAFARVELRAARHVVRRARTTGGWTRGRAHMPESAQAIAVSRPVRHRRTPTPRRGRDAADDRRPRAAGARSPRWATPDYDPANVRASAEATARHPGRRGVRRRAAARARRRPSGRLRRRSPGPRARPPCCCTRTTTCSPRAPLEPWDYASVRARDPRRTDVRARLGRRQVRDRDPCTRRSCGPGSHEGDAPGHREGPRRGRGGVLHRAPARARARARRPAAGRRRRDRGRRQRTAPASPRSTRACAASPTARSP